MISDFFASLWAIFRAEAQTLSMVVTAAATIALGFFTWVLARETKRLSAAAAQAHVVATLEPNHWSVRHFDLVVSNTGNAAAHDVAVAFSPDLSASENIGRPLRHVSVLKPGQSLLSYVGSYEAYHEKTFKVLTSWKHHPKAKKRQSLEYELAMGDYADFGHLGARSPLIQMAEELKRLREDWQWVARGSHKIKTDSYSSADREQERKRLEALRKSRTKPLSQTTPPQKPRKPKPGGGI